MRNLQITLLALALLANSTVFLFFSPRLIRPLPSNPARLKPLRASGNSRPRTNQTKSSQPRRAPIAAREQQQHQPMALIIQAGCRPPCCCAGFVLQHQVFQILIVPWRICW